MPLKSMDFSTSETKVIFAIMKDNEKSFHITEQLTSMLLLRKDFLTCLAIFVQQHHMIYR